MATVSWSRKRSFPAKVEEIGHIWSMDRGCLQTKDNMPSKEERKIWKKTWFYCLQRFFSNVNFGFGSRQRPWKITLFTFPTTNFLPIFKHKNHFALVEEDQSLLTISYTQKWTLTAPKFILPTYLSKRNHLHGAFKIELYKYDWFSYYITYYNITLVQKGVSEKATLWPSLEHYTAPTVWNGPFLINIIMVEFKGICSDLWNLTSCSTSFIKSFSKLLFLRRRGRQLCA